MEERDALRAGDPILVDGKTLSVADIRKLSGANEKKVVEPDGTVSFEDTVTFADVHSLDDLKALLERLLSKARVEFDVAGERVTFASVSPASMYDEDTDTLHEVPGMFEVTWTTEGADGIPEEHQDYVSASGDLGYWFLAEGGDWGKWRKVIEAVFEDVDLPRITKTARHFDAMRKESTDALVRRNRPPLGPKHFLQGGVPVYVVRDENGWARITRMGPTQVFEALSRAADWYTQVPDGFVLDATGQPVVDDFGQPIPKFRDIPSRPDKDVAAGNPDDARHATSESPVPPTEG